MTGAKTCQIGQYHQCETSWTISQRGSSIRDEIKGAGQVKPFTFDFWTMKTTTTTRNASCPEHPILISASSEQASESICNRQFRKSDRATQIRANLERAQERLVDAHHSSGIVKFSAVIWRGEQGHQLLPREELIAVFHDLTPQEKRQHFRCHEQQRSHLMRTANEVHVVLCQEALYHVAAECERHAAVIFSPSMDIGIRIGP